jgi:transposase
MGKTYRGYEPKQKFLLPPSPEDWLPPGHLAYFVQDVVSELDLREIDRRYEKEERGGPPYHPEMMVGLLLYAYCVGVPSSRKIERKTHEDVAFRVLAAGNHPDHTRVSEFRRIHSKALAKLFKQVLQLCIEAGLVKLGHVSLDGTKLKANASKHKAMSYGRMKEKEAELEKKVTELLSAAEKADTEDDARLGKGKRDEDLPAELRLAETRLARIRTAKAALEAEAKAAAELEKEEAAKEKSGSPPDEGAGGGSSELPSHKVAHTKDGLPTEKAQRNFTDAQSRIQKTNDGFMQGFNAQAAVDAQAQIIVAQALTNQSPDAQHLVPVLALIAENCGALPEKLSADAGYFSEENVAALERDGIDPYLATGRSKHGASPIPVRGRPPADLTVKQRMARKLKTKAGRAVYSRRKAIVEPVFGQVKGARGLRGILRRGIEAARDEWALICTTHNLLKLFRFAAA